MITDPFERGIEYLKQVPLGKVTIPVKEAKEVSQFKNRNAPLHEMAQQWATAHGFTFSTDRAEKAAATLFYFRNRR